MTASIRTTSSELVKLNTEGRVHLVDGDDIELFPGIRAYTGGRHTYAAQYIRVDGNPPFVLASDNVYLYRNLSEHKPSATFTEADYPANLRCAAAHDRARRLRGPHRSGARCTAVSEISHRGPGGDVALKFLCRFKAAATPGCRGSGFPAKYFSSARTKGCGSPPPSRQARAKSVIQERNFRSSGDPRISRIERSAIAFTSSVTSLRRGPRTG